MSASQGVPAEAFHGRLAHLGFMLTGARTETAQIWEHVDRHIFVQIPFPVDGEYPQEVVIDLERQLEDLLA